MEETTILDGEKWYFVAVNAAIQRAARCPAVVDVILRNDRGELKLVHLLEEDMPLEFHLESYEVLAIVSESQRLAIRIVKCAMEEGNE